MINGQCQQLRQLACSDPARLSSMVWLSLKNLKQQVEQHIENERRQQQRMGVSGAAAVLGNLTSEGVPLSSLLAPVSVSAPKPGRPSSKRAHAAMEGRAAAKLKLVMPAAAMVEGGQAEGEAAVDGAGQKAGRKRQKQGVSSSAAAAVTVTATAAAVAVAAAAASASAAASVSAPLSFPCSVSAAAAASASAACSAVELGRGKRVIVAPVHLRD
jgi:hypothetical protein